MKIALPINNGVLCMHFGHCSEFALFDVELSSKKITGIKNVIPPPHEPGVLPRWLHDQGVELVIAGGMGTRAQQIFQQAGIKVIVGVSAQDPNVIIQNYLDGCLEAGENVCGH